MGARSITPMGHVRMMAAVQPFISGAISKTVNMPETATVEEVEEIYFEAWKMGVKALAIYRDNCKVGQPLSDAKAKKADELVDVTAEAVQAALAGQPVRKRLPKSRPSVTTSFSVAGAEGYMTAGSYPDNGLGEVFLKLGKQGSTLAGVMDAFSIAISIALQYGVPLEAFVSKFVNMRFEPAGMTDDPDIRISQSIMDYIFRRLALDYLPYEKREALGIFTADEQIGADVSDLFNVLTGYARPDAYRRVLVSPDTMRPGILEQIEKTVEAHQEGQETRISLKLNSLVDRKCIQALYEASQAGVEIEINVRGICCLRPGVPGVSENIRVVSIVGRFLEHSRIYAFRRGDESTVLIGSADLMPRNLDSRVELVTPLLDEAARDQALDVLERCFADNVNAWILDSSGNWSRLQPEGGGRRDVQKELRERHDALEATTAPQLAG